jgi:hypothetical protein
MARTVAAAEPIIPLVRISLMWPKIQATISEHGRHEQNEGPSNGAFAPKNNAVVRNLV